jgi:tRNA G18 (ribose-2'-O)-methylase SpoU
MTPLLIAEEIAGEWNNQALAAIARVFALEYCQHAEIEEDLHTLYGIAHLVASENLPDSACVYNYRPPAQTTWGIVVGNEAKGLRRRTLKQADAIVEVPVLSKTINCLNVAAAAAVMLYYLNQPRPLKYETKTLKAIQKRRPDLLLVSGKNPMELGSTLRSACAFGWQRVFLQDRGHCWYECDRMIKSQGRGAARRARNPIRVLPWDNDSQSEYQRLIVATVTPGNRNLWELPLITSSSLVVLADEAAGSYIPPATFQGEILYASLPLISAESYFYRQAATIALAELARQLGNPQEPKTPRRRQSYRREVVAEETGIILDMEDLLMF